MTSDKQQPVDELFWELLALVTAERDALEKLLRQLSSNRSKSDKRTYPEVLPKYRNPNNRSETWCGRGKYPRWLATELRNGKMISDFLISPALRAAAETSGDAI